MRPLELLFERAQLPRFGVSSSLSRAYGGDFGIGEVRAYANFVSSLDGVVALERVGDSGRIVSGDSKPDRFVMALLRACADAVVIGAETFSQAPGAFWDAAYIFPELSEAFDELRKQLRLRPLPLLVVVSASGKLDTTRPALRNAVVATTRAGEEKLRGALPAGARVVALDPRVVPLAPLFELLRSEGCGRVLTEGGPRLFGALMKENLVDELFLTVSPRLFGRGPGDGRKSLVDGVELDASSVELLSARRHSSHLFLRYALTGG